MYHYSDIPASSSTRHILTPLDNNQGTDSRKSRLPNLSRTYHPNNLQTPSTISMGNTCESQTDSLNLAMQQSTSHPSSECSTAVEPDNKHSGAKHLGFKGQGAPNQFAKSLPRLSYPVVRIHVLATCGRCHKPCPQLTSCDQTMQKSDCRTNPVIVELEYPWVIPIWEASSRSEP